MGTGEKNVPPDTGYHRYEIIGDNMHYTDVLCSEKVIRCRRVPVRGITLTVGVFFDGTGNNRVNSDDLRLAYAHCAGLVGEERARACAKYEEHARAGLGNGSWQGGITNISRLFDLYQLSDELNDSEADAQVKAYVSGIGTADGKSDSVFGQALGSSLIRQFEGVVTKTDEALDKISAELTRFIKLNRDKVAIAKVQFDVFGFSRGAAAARHFANRVVAQDTAIAAAIDSGLDMAGHHGKAAGEVRFLGLFDTVAAIGSLLNFYGVIRESIFRRLDPTEPSQSSVGAWSQRVGGFSANFNIGKALPVRMTVCWDSVIDKKAYETEIWFSRETWQQMTTAYADSYKPGKTYYRDNMIIGLAPGGTVRVWLEDNGDPVVLQHPARQLTLTGDDMLICKGVTKHPNGYVYYGKTPDFIKGKTYPYGNW